MTKERIWRMSLALVVGSVIASTSACTAPGTGAPIGAADPSTPATSASEATPSTNPASDLEVFFAAREQYREYLEAHSSSSSDSNWFADDDFRQTLQSFVSAKAQINRSDLWLNTNRDATGPGLSWSAAQAVEEASRSVGGAVHVTNIDLRNEGALLSWKIDFETGRQQITVTVDGETGAVTDVDD
ncbi:hypothetical protein PlfCFBP13513_14935 [Plantibacter flavus]|uniref:PepSY domain-containing protein n=1 Tax=Plantibacter TaxID=190323 RepID=UPI0010C17A84|nr:MULTISPECIES: PepSY domain-containing protein [Plantibacter]MBD8103789.1 PepSY domain-containing protein [Plantibacter sp. CFBP 8775]MBD8467238.1 PepSY domain-containing protein [Plantibacter sp. CFBP 8798]TKJ96717.1 hypothetical protein PlfCFBP13513_14935 [Plantibacter flavus]